MQQSFRSQQKIYTMHQRTWPSRNDCHNHVWDEQILPNPRIDSPHLLEHCFMSNGSLNPQQDGWPGSNGFFNHVSIVEKLPTNYNNASLSSNSGVLNFNKRMMDGEYDTFQEVISVPVAMRTTQQVVKYEHSSRHYCQIQDEVTNWQHNGFGNFGWIVKGP
ncbi:hypothetical protein L1049_005811 [Liquidambar formosana]|uniref:Uncharacterized protein n=1 Tax=Liquidambar formosana TaxID=63359 RepID=A0AAP0WTB8_LIQFO